MPENQVQKKNPDYIDAYVTVCQVLDAACQRGILGNLESAAALLTARNTIGTALGRLQALEGSPVKEG